jgi:hypothetical protein
MIKEEAPKISVRAKCERSVAPARRQNMCATGCDQAGHSTKMVRMTRGGSGPFGGATVTPFNNATPDSAESAAGRDPNDVYREVCAGIRATDEISLKLLAAVPLATGIGITLLVKAPDTKLPDGARALLSLFAAVVTFAIYRWERKNIATCSHFREWAAILERDYFKLSRPTSEDLTQGLPHGKVLTVPAAPTPVESSPVPTGQRPRSSRRRIIEVAIRAIRTASRTVLEVAIRTASIIPGRSWGKTEAEKLLYGTAILGWMLSFVYSLAQVFR